MVIVPHVLGAPVLSKENGGCNGAWMINWTAIAGATSYEVWVDYPTQGAYTLLSTTTSLGLLVHSQDNAVATHVKVQACEGTTCGTFSNVEALPYFSGCP